MPQPRTSGGTEVALYYRGYDIHSTAFSKEDGFYGFSGVGRGLRPQFSVDGYKPLLRLTSRFLAKRHG